MTDFRGSVSESGKSGALNREIFNITDIPVPEGCGAFAISIRRALATAIPLLTGNPIPSFAPQLATVPLTGESPCRRVFAVKLFAAT